MPYRDLRHFIETLESSGEARRVPVEVDWRYEVTAWLYYSEQQRPKGPALLFEKLRDYPAGYRLFGGGLSTFGRIARALDLPPETPVRALIEAVRQRLKQPLPPTVVADGPVRENRHVGDEVDLLEFPTPWWHPRDGGRYIGTCHAVISRDPETGRRNAGIYRMQIQDARHVTIAFLPTSHLGIHYNRSSRQGESLPVAVTIGADETLILAAGNAFPQGLDELALAGALRGEPIAMVRCETVDLEVPANAEIVLEGELLPGERWPEGPYGEHTGYHGGGVRMRPVMRLTGITHRQAPILRGTYVGRPVVEHHLINTVGISASAMNWFESQGPDGVTAVYCPPEAVSGLVSFIQMRPRYVGHSRQVARAYMSGPVGARMKHVVVVDDDVDVFDPGQVWWAITTRVQGSRDVEVLRFQPGSRSDPSIPRAQGEFGDAMIIDATKKLDYPPERIWGGPWAPVTVPPAEVVDLVSLRWRQLFDGAEVDQTKLEATKTHLEADLYPAWERWRQEAYVLSPEERLREIARSMPSS